MKSFGPSAPVSAAASPDAHREERPPVARRADLVDLRNPRMLQLAKDRGLVAKPLEHRRVRESGPQQLACHPTLQALLLGE